MSSTSTAADNKIDVPKRDAQAYSIRYEADENSEYYRAHVARLSILNDLVALLPETFYSFAEQDEHSDYPVVSNSILDEVQVFYHDDRPVFTIGGYAFFRRYNDHYNSTVVYGVPGSSNVSWRTDIGRNALQKLYELAQSKDIVKITNDEVRTALWGTTHATNKR